MSELDTNNAVSAEPKPGGFRQRACALLEWRYFLLACLVLACALRVMCILSIEPQLGSDCFWYYSRAVSLANGDGYVVDGRAAVYFPVGYPAFLALVFKLSGPSELAGKLANTVLYLGLIALSYALARELFRDRVVAGLTALVLAIWPANIMYSSVLLSEALYTFLTMLGIWLVLKARTGVLLSILAGVVFGCATLTREVGWFVPLVTIVVLWRAEKKPDLRRRWGSALVITNVVMLLMILPWTIRNYRAIGHLVPVSTNSGMNLYLGNSPHSTGGFICAPSVFAPMLADGRVPRTDWEWNERCRDYAIRYAIGHPVREMELVGRRLFRLYVSELDSVGWVEGGLDSEQEMDVLRGLVQSFYMVVMAMFLLGLGLRVLRRRKNAQVHPLPTLGLWLMAYWTLGVLTTFGVGRFHYPMTPWIAMYVGAVLVPWLTRNRQIENRKSQMMDLPAASPELRTMGPGVNS